MVSHPLKSREGGREHTYVYTQVDGREIEREREKEEAEMRSRRKNKNKVD